MLLKEGDRNDNVKILQRALRIMCCDPKGIDGIFGAGCTAAVKKYQGLQGITQTGICDDETWESLRYDIAGIQLSLMEMGYLPDASGTASEATYNAILAVQRDNGLTADGMVGPATRRVLGSYSLGDDSSLPLKIGSRGSKVTCFQYGLRLMCCNPGNIDGTYGSRTEAATKKFQQNHGLSVDGIVGTATWNKMKEKISEIQEAIVDKNFTNLVIDGVAGPSTYDSVVEFQRKYGLAADGMVGPATREILFGTASDGPDALPLKLGMSGGLVVNLQYGLRIAVINCELTGRFDDQTLTSVKKFQSRNGLDADGIVGTKTWEKMRELVKKYQIALINLKYEMIATDGVADHNLYKAILVFQKANGLDANGMCGTQTQTLLFGGVVTGSGTTSKTLKKGSSGDLVRYLQYMMNTLGYSVTIDGIFGSGLETAVKQFQTKKGLDADGIVGLGTWKELFNDYEVPVGGTGLEKMLNIAKYERDIGFKEYNGNNINPYGIWYGRDGYWCAMFVSFCARKAGISESLIPQYHYTPTGANWYSKRGRYHKRASGYIPKKGDVVFFFGETDNRINHTGIVISVDTAAGNIYTIEGNTSDGVYERVRAMRDTYIDGYGDNGGATGDDNQMCGGNDYNSVKHHRLIKQSDNKYYCSDCKFSIDSPVLEDFNVIARLKSEDQNKYKAKILALETALAQYKAMKEEGDLGNKSNETVPSIGEYYMPEKIMHTLDRTRGEIHNLALANSKKGYQYQNVVDGSSEFGKEYEPYYKPLHLTTEFYPVSVQVVELKTDDDVLLYNGLFKELIETLFSIILGGLVYIPKFASYLIAAMKFMKSVTDKNATWNDYVNDIYSLIPTEFAQETAGIVGLLLAADPRLGIGDYYTVVRDAVSYLPGESERVHQQIMVLDEDLGEIKKIVWEDFTVGN